MAIVAISTNPAAGPVGVRFVALETFHPVEVVTFTDRGWLARGAFRAGEGLSYWDVDRLVPAGTVVELGGLPLGPGADSVIAFVGVLAPDGSPTDSLLFGVQLGGAWQADATSDATSARPPALAGFEVALGAFLDCAYAGPTVGTRSELLARVADADNWTCHDTIRPAAPSSFTVYVDRGRGCGVDAECGPGMFCSYGVCCDSECRRTEPGHCVTCDFGNFDPRTGTCGPAPATTLCRTGRGPCDPMDHCDGVGAECPPNVPLGPAHVCRAPTGGCDPAEACDGVAPECPADVVATPGATCRPSLGACDPEEVCADGPACPDDRRVPDGTACDDGLACTASSSCEAGRCAGPVPLACDDGDPCTADACRDEGGCDHAPIAGCCEDAADCDDGDPCTRDACGADHACERAPSCDAGELARDAGADAGAVHVGGGACGCGVPRDRAPGGGLAALLVLAIRGCRASASRAPRGRGCSAPSSRR